MDYKEKYEKALEWMKSIYPTMQGSDKEDAEHYFPELAESEDERMVRRIESFLYAYGLDYFPKDELLEVEAWLERQKEQPTNSEIPKELKPEWSEADEKMLSVITYKISQHQGNDERSLFTPDEAEFICEIEDKLKSLRPILPEDTLIFRKGVEEGKRLMMEEAVEGEYGYFSNASKTILPGGKLNLKEGDKVRIIIVKEDKK